MQPLLSCTMAPALATAHRVGSVLIPSSSCAPRRVPRDPAFQYLTMSIGDMVTVEENAVVEAAQIGSYVHIGKNCVIVRVATAGHRQEASGQCALRSTTLVARRCRLFCHRAPFQPMCCCSIVSCVQGRRCLLKDCCRIEDGTVLAPDTIVPPFCVFGGSPGTERGPCNRRFAPCYPLARCCMVCRNRSFLPCPPYFAPAHNVCRTSGGRASGVVQDDPPGSRTGLLPALRGQPRSQVGCATR